MLRICVCLASACTSCADLSAKSDSFFCRRMRSSCLVHFPSPFPVISESLWEQDVGGSSVPPRRTLQWSELRMADFVAEEVAVSSLHAKCPKILSCKGEVFFTRSAAWNWRYSSYDALHYVQNFRKCFAKPVSANCNLLIGFTCTKSVVGGLPIGRYWYSAHTLSKLTEVRVLKRVHLLFVLHLSPAGLPEWSQSWLTGDPSSYKKSSIPLNTECVLLVAWCMLLTTDWF